MGEWREPPPAPDFRPGVVDVWRASFGEAAGAGSLFEGWLSAEERARAAAFAFDRERRLFVASRGLLRTVLSRYAAARPEALEIVADALGKPRLGGRCGQGRVRFNASHTGDLWACAVALHREVGIDVEWIRPDRGIDRIAGRYFSPAEVAALGALPEAQRPAAFHRCWTRKEAWLKARGFGITVPLGSFDVSLGEEARVLATRPDPAEAARWTLADVDFGPGFAATVCIEGGPAELRRWRVNGGERNGGDVLH